MMRKLLAALTALAWLVPAAASAEPFEFIRIGDADGFGFARTADLVRATQEPHDRPADSDGDGILGEGEFLPDLNRDGGVAYRSEDNFDNRSVDESGNRAHKCVGCLTVGERTSGSIWTDLSLSITAPNVDWPDSNGPSTPNNAVFVFDFKVSGDDIVPGAQIFFNLVFGDYDIDPALIAVQFRDSQPRALELANQGLLLDGLIQGRSAVLDFDDVFEPDGEGNWDGLVLVIFLAPADPYTAFDYVELSVFGLVTASAEPHLNRDAADAGARPLGKQRLAAARHAPTE